MPTLHVRSRPHPAAQVPPKQSPQDLQALQADVASFASSLGFAAADAAGTGFNDIDFRRTGPINAKKARKSSSKEKLAAAEEIVQSEKTERGHKRKKSGSFDTHSAQKAETPNTQNKKLKNNAAGKPSNKNSRQGRSKGSFEKRESSHDDRSGRQSAPQIRFHDQQGGGDRGFVEKDQSFKSKGLPVLDSGPWYESVGSETAKLFPKTGEATQVLGQAAGQMAQKEVGCLKAAAFKWGSGAWENTVRKAQEKGEKLMESVAADYENSRGKDSDMRWLMVARKSGTTADKVAALTILLQDNPIANVKALDALLGTVTSKGGKRHAAIGVDALKELFLTSLLPDRKLRFLTQQPLAALPDSQDGATVLLFWTWEDCLKHRYERFVMALEQATRDTLPFYKEKALKTVFELLKSKPEQERKLLSVLVNKLGDPERKVASNASYYLSCLLTLHPNMKMVVVEEVDRFLFRPHLEVRSRYHAVVFLNQIVLSNKGDGSKLAKRLIDLYFALFKIITVGEAESGKATRGKESSDARKQKRSGKNKQAEVDVDAAIEIDSRLLSSLLTGVNRAFPFVAAEDVDTLIEEHTPVLFRMVHSKSFNVGVQALMLLHQLLLKNQAVSDRFYRSLYAVLHSPNLVKSSKAEMFLGLTYKAIKSDIDSKRMAAFAKRLLQVALQQPPHFACGCLFLLSEVLKSRSALWNAVLQPEDEDEDTEHFQDIIEEEGKTAAANVLEASEREIEGKGENSSGSDTEELGCAVLDLGHGDDSSSQDEEEHPKSRENSLFSLRNDGMVNTATGAGCLVESPNKSSMDKFVFEPEHRNGVVLQGWPRKGCYNPRHREPMFCNADQACWWELTALASHVHPSVATMAKTLLSGANILYAGDPLRDLALGVFLDRFAEKKPKSRRKQGDTWHGSSLSAPTRKGATSSSLPVGPEFLQISERDVAPEDIVFHKFYITKSGTSKQKKKKEREVDDEITAVGDDDDFLSGDDSDNKEIDDLLEQDAAVEMDLTEESGSEDEGISEDYDYENLERVFELANNEAGLEENELDEELESTLLEDTDTELDTAENIDGDLQEGSVLKKGGGSKRKRTSKSRKKLNVNLSRHGSSKVSPFANIEDYAHMLNKGVSTEDIDRSPILRVEKRHRHRSAKASW